jgi:hypothetical protein
MASLSLAVFLAATLSATGSGAEARRVAVLDFNARWAAGCAKAQGAADEERCDMLKLLADQSRAGALAVLRPPDYVVMTRENTAQILKDMGGVCSEGECEVETARLLGAKVVVSGDVSLLEGTWLVSLKVHDVGTAALLGTGSTEGKTKLEAFRNVRNETERMLKAAVGLDGSTPRVAAAPPPKKPDPEGTLRLEVADEDAVVVLDGKEVGRGPLKQDKKLLEGTHRLVVMKEGHATFEEAYRIEAGARVTASPRLVAIPRTVGAPPPKAVEPWEQQRWYVELAPAIPSGVANGVSVESFAPFGGVSVTARVGLRLAERWALEASFLAGEVDFRRGSNFLSVKEEGGLGVGAAYAPGGSRHFSLAFGGGASSVKSFVSTARLPGGGSSEDMHDGTEPFVYGEARYDWSFGAFSFGLRAGVRALLSIPATQAGTVGTDQHIEVKSDASVVTFPLAVGARYNF